MFETLLELKLGEVGLKICHWLGIGLGLGIGQGLKIGQGLGIGQVLGRGQGLDETRVRLWFGHGM